MPSVNQESVVTPCSFCNRRHDAYELIWAPTGTTICSFCVATFWHSAKRHGAPRGLPISEARVPASEAHVWRIGGVLPRTHTFHLRGAARICAYGLPGASRVVLLIDGPWAPDRCRNERT
ncbi:MAG: hypothetical protein HS104_21975 [Polyangiaceae bacterium]|nr:hypothetical protein [Polyangiaceae bacterium]